MTATVDIHLLHAADSDAEELSRAAFGFLKQVRELDIQSADLASDREAPVGTKAGDALALGHIVVLAVPTATLLRGLISLARVKVQSDATRTVSLTINGHTLEIANASPAVQETAMQHWMRVVAEDEPDA